MKNKKKSRSTTTSRIVNNDISGILTTAESQVSEVSLSDIPNITQHTATTIENNEAILGLFPDIELSMKILISLVRSPSGLNKSILNYTMRDRLLPTSAKGKIVRTVQEYVTATYKLESKLSNIIKETLFTKGSYSELILPYETLEDIIISNSHTVKKSKDNDNKVWLGVESGDTSLSNLFTHNGDVSVGLEKATTKDKKKLAKSIFRKVKYKDISKLEVSTVKRYSFEDNQYGNSLVMKVDTRAVIPVCSKSDPSMHIGYFLAVDEHGNIVPSEDSSTFTNLDENIKTLMGSMNINLKHNEKKVPTLETAFTKFSEKIDESIKESLSEKRLSTLGAVKDVEWVYSIMFSRALKGMKTKLLYVNKDNLQYYAIEHHANGVGKSLLEKVMPIVSLRAILTYASVNAHVKNSVTQTKVEATLDANDPTPKKTMAMIDKGIMKAKMDKMPVGTLKPSELTAWLHRAGVYINYKHPKLPNMTVEIDESNTSKETPSTDLMDNLKKISIRAFGIPPALIDDADDVQFASTVLASNTMIRETVKEYQALLNPCFTSHVYKLFINNTELKHEVGKVIEEEYTSILKYLPKETQEEIKKDKIPKSVVISELVEEVIYDLEVALPVPAYDENDSTKGAFDAYTSKLDDAVKVYFGEEALPEELVNKIAGKSEDLQTSIKLALTRKWIAENNYLPELTDMLTVSDDGKENKGILDEFNTYIEQMGEALKPFFKDVKKGKKKLDEVVDKFENEDDPEPEEPVADNETKTDTVDNTTGETNTAGDNTDETTDDVTEDTGDEFKL